jgi:hypothetical protein
LIIYLVLLIDQPKMATSPRYHQTISAMKWYMIEFFDQGLDGGDHEFPSLLCIATQHLLSQVIVSSHPGPHFVSFGIEITGSMGPAGLPVGVVGLAGLFSNAWSALVTYNSVEPLVKTNYAIYLDVLLQRGRDSA